MIGLREYAVFGIVNFLVGSLVGAFFLYKIVRKRYELVPLEEGI